MLSHKSCHRLAGIYVGNRGLIKQPRGSARARVATPSRTSLVIKPSITRYDEGVIFD